MTCQNTYVYELDGNLYINLTNACSNRCTFCVRNGKDSYYGNSLWLNKLPTAEDVLSQIPDVKKYPQIVFCGFGEPTERLDVLLEIATVLKQKGAYVRLNTNGQADLINQKKTAPLLKGKVDKINVSLNAPTAKEYQAVCLSRYGEQAFDALLTFAKDCQNEGIDVVLSVVDVIGEDAVARCRALTEKHGLKLRVREMISDS